MKKKIIIGISIFIIVVLVAIAIVINKNNGNLGNLLNQVNANKESINQENVNLENENQNEIAQINLEKRSYTKIEELPEDYSTDQAVQDKCVVIKQNVEVDNMDVLEDFIKNMDEKRETSIRIVEFTEEGDKIIKDVSLVEDGTITYTTDTTRDKFSTEEDRKIETKTYNIDEYKIIQDEYKDVKRVYLENINKEINSRVLICTYPFEMTYNQNFNLSYYQRKDLGINKVLEKGDIIDYDVYTFGGDVLVQIEDMVWSLEEAVKQNVITMDDIIHKCVADEKEEKIETSMYKDGGSTVYKYADYWIIKCYSLDENRDVYIGMPNMNFTGNSVEIIRY